MKNKYIKMLALVVCLNLGTTLTQAMPYTFIWENTVTLPTPANSINGNGYVWFGNFGSSSSSQPFTLDQVQTNAGSGINSLLDSFRPANATGFTVTNGSLMSNGSPTQELRGNYNAATSFFGEYAYIVALASPSSSWTSALAAWKGDNVNSAIVFSADAIFVGPSDPTQDFGLDRNSGTFIFGSQTGTSIIATTAAVPEPSVASLLLVGTLGLLALRQSRGKV